MDFSNLPPSLSLKQAAQALGVHKRTIKRWMDDGDLDGWRTPGGHRKVHKESLLKLMENDQGDGAKVVDILRRAGA